MPHLPRFRDVLEAGRHADYVPVYRRVLSDVLTPVSAFHKIDDGGSGVPVRKRHRRRKGRPLQLSRRASRFCCSKLAATQR